MPAARTAMTMLLLGLTGTGCASAPSPAPSAPAAVAHRCVVDTGVEMTPLASRESDEPFIAVPTPEGWKISHRNDSESIRGGLISADLRAKRFTPNAVISLIDVSQDSKDETQAIANEQADIEAQPEVSSMSSEDGTLCGYPSRTLRYKHKELDGTTMIVAGKDRSNRTWLAAVLVQTAEPENPKFIRDRATILKSFQFVVPEDGNVAQ